MCSSDLDKPSINRTVSEKDIQIGSKYNKNKVIHICEICKEKDAVDVHHINQQCDANHMDLLDSLEDGIFNKNKLWNLVALCKECHQAVHNVPSRLIIKGYQTTNQGIELIYTWTDTTGNDCISNSNSDSDNDSNKTLHNISSSSKNKNTNQDTKSKNTRNSKNSKQIEISEEIKNKIIDWKKINTTPKKIQYDIKRYHNIDITQQQIRDVC